QEMLRRLDLLGITELGQLGALPPTALQSQFGREGLLAWRLIHGEEPGRIVPERDALRVVERLDLPAPAVQDAPLVVAVDILLQRAMRHREIGGRAIRR